MNKTISLARLPSTIIVTITVAFAASPACAQMRAIHGSGVTSTDVLLVAQKRPSTAQIQQMIQSGQVPAQYMQFVPAQYRQSGGVGGNPGGAAVDVQGGFNGSGVPHGGVNDFPSGSTPAVSGLPPGVR